MKCYLMDKIKPGNRRLIFVLYRIFTCNVKEVTSEKQSFLDSKEYVVNISKRKISNHLLYYSVSYIFSIKRQICPEGYKKKL